MDFGETGENREIDWRLFVRLTHEINRTIVCDSDTRKDFRCCGGGRVWGLGGPGREVRGSAMSVGEDRGASVGAANRAGEGERTVGASSPNVQI